MPALLVVKTFWIGIQSVVSMLGLELQKMEPCFHIRQIMEHQDGGE